MHLTHNHKETTMKRKKRSRPRRNQDREVPWGLILEIADDSRGLFRGTRENLSTIISALRAPHEMLVASREASIYMRSLWESIEDVPAPHRLRAAKLVLTAVVEEAFDTIVRSGTFTGSSEDDANEDGPSEDGSSEDDANEDGPSEDGPSEDGPSEDGPSEDGPSEDGPSEDGPSEDGPSEDGPSEDE
jgi:hypothetical protein